MNKLKDTRIYGDLLVDGELKKDGLDIVTKPELDIEVDKLVTKETGKGLSSNDYTDVDKGKLANIEVGAQVNPTPLTNAQIKTQYESNTNTNAYTDIEKTKLAGIESGAQVNPYTKTELDTKYDSKVDKVTGKQLSTNDYTTTEKNKLAGIQAGAQVNPTPLTNAQIKTQYEANANTNAFTDSEKSKLGGIATGAQVNPTSAQIKISYESNADTNTFTDLEKSKLTGIESGAQVNTVTSVAGKTGVVTLVKGDVGLGSVDNTSDANKPVSTAVKSELNTKLNQVWTDVSVQTTTFLTDELVFNRGNVLHKATLANLLANVPALELFDIVAELPLTGVANKIYLVPKEGEESNNGFEEFIWVDGEWELLGSIEINLDNYFTKPEITALLAGKLNAVNAGETSNKTLTYGGTFKVLQTLANGTTNERTMTMPAAIDISGKVDKVAGKGLSDENYTAAEKSKLGGIESGAQVNTVQNIGRFGEQADIISHVLTNSLHSGLYLTGFDYEDTLLILNRGGTYYQATMYNADGWYYNVNVDFSGNIVSYKEGMITDLVTLTEVQSLLTSKVDVVSGKGLSTEDYTTAEKNKLSGIASGAQVNTITSVAGKTGAVSIVAGDITSGTFGVDRIPNLGIDKITDFEDEVLSISPAGSRPASDVSAWAKAANKPGYNFGEISGKPTTIAGYGITDASTKSEITTLLEGKVDVVVGKTLSTNDFTNTHLNNVNKIPTIETYIPTEASAANQLADKDYVVNAVQSLASRYVTYNALGAPFPTLTALTSATDFYYQGQTVTLIAGDNTLVSEDANNNGLQASYYYDGSNWIFRYTIGSAFTSTQQNALDSGITSGKVSTYDGYAATIASKAETTLVNTKLTQVNTGSSLRLYGISAGNSQTMYAGVSGAITNNSFPMRDSAGTFWVGPATNANHPVQFSVHNSAVSTLESAIATKADKLNLSQYQIPTRTTAGTGEANTGVTYSVTATASTIAQRDVNGRMVVTDAVNNNQAATLGQINTINENLVIDGGTF